MNHPNFVLINCDDLGYGDIGCYGSQLNKTPFIDQLANEGLKFTDFYACSPVCSPSRGGMMVGCYPKRISFENFDGERVLKPGQGVGLNPNEVTIAKLLQSHGYKTMLAGKWHCGDQKEFLPINHGFDEWYGLPYSNDMGRQNRTWDTLENLDKRYPPLPLMDGNDIIEEQPEQESLIERYVEAANRFIKKNKETPFFLYFSPIQVHLPLYAPKSFYKDSLNGDFGACVACVDWAVSALTHQLKACGVYENTLIIFTSDNGSRGDHGASNSPLKGHKMQNYEGGVRVPCIMHYKAGILPGQVTNKIAGNIDFYRTFAKLANIEIDENNDSVDMSPLFHHEEVDYQRNSWVYYYEECLEAVRINQYKLFISRDKKEICELYDLSKDIGENANIAEQNETIVCDLKAFATLQQLSLGDARLGIQGEHVRPIGRVDNPKMLTNYDPTHPYMIAVYDNEDDG